MNINTDNMQKVTDVNKRSYSPDLKYSEETERWTMNENVQDALNLGGERGLNMYLTEDMDTGEQVVVVEIVDSEEAEFFTGSGNVFVARRMGDAVDHHSFALEPIEGVEEEMYALREWEGDSHILENMFDFESSDGEQEEDYQDDLEGFQVNLNDEEESMTDGSSSNNSSDEEETVLA